MMSRRSPAPGSKTAHDYNKGMSGGLDVRKQRATASVEREGIRIKRERIRINQLVASLPRLTFDEAGYVDFKPEDTRQLEALQLAAKRFDWGIQQYASTGVYEVLCKIKNAGHLKRQHDAKCRALVPRLHFQRDPNGMTAICNNPERSEDLRHGLDLEAIRYGWTVNHINLAVSYVRKPYHRNAVYKAA